MDKIYETNDYKENGSLRIDGCLIKEVSIEVFMKAISSIEQSWVNPKQKQRMGRFLLIKYNGFAGEPFAFIIKEKFLFFFTKSIKYYLKGLDNG